MFQAEKQLLKGFINLKLKHDILEGRKLNISLCLRIFFFNFLKYLLNFYFNLSQRTTVSPSVPCFSYWAERRPVILAIIKADVLQKGGKSHCFKGH